MALAINKDNFEALVAGDQPVVIDFWAEWCGPCRTMSPIVDELAAEYEGKVVIGKCDVEENDDITMKYGVRNIPTIVFLKGGELVDKQVGAMPEGCPEGQDREASLMLRAIDFHGLKGVEFSKGEYTALLIPEMGANLVRLANTRLGAEILRTPGPGEIETFRSRPQVFGLPILFPPNRIADGRYVFEGRTYQYPITIERERNYHHGVLKSEAFLVSKARETDREVMIECRYYANAGNDAVYRDFPHEFKCKITYRLTAEGLEQEVVFFNRSETRMPLGVGFHTPLTIPFAGGIDADYVMRLAVGEEVELDGRNLPTGRRLPLSEQFSKLRREGLQVTGCGPIEAGFTLREIDVDGKPFRGALVEHLAHGRENLLRGRRADDLLDAVEQRRASALLLSRAADMDHERPQRRRSRGRRVSGH